MSFVIIPQVKQLLDQPTPLVIVPKDTFGGGTVTDVSVTSTDGIVSLVTNPTTNPNINLSLGDITPDTVNGLTLSEETEGFTISGGVDSKTLTVPSDASVSGTNTGDQAVETLTNVSITDPELGQALLYKGANTWANGNIQTSSPGPGISFYPIDTTIVPSGATNDYVIKSLSESPSTSPEEVYSISSTSASTVLFGAFLNPTALGRTSLNGGSWVFDIYAGISSTSGASKIKQNFNKVTPWTNVGSTSNYGTNLKSLTTTGNPFSNSTIDYGGTIDSDSFIQTPSGFYRIVEWAGDNNTCVISVPTGYVNETDIQFSIHKRLFQVETNEINNIVTPPSYTGMQLYDITEIEDSYAIDTTSLISTTFFFTTTASSATTVYFSIQSNTRYSHINSPLVYTHNQLPGLQGGSANEEYHLTQSEYTGTGSGVMVRANAPAFTGLPTATSLTPTTDYQLATKKYVDDNSNPGTVTSVTSANNDISVANQTTTPTLTLNSGTGANQIVKFDANAKYPSNSGENITNVVHLLGDQTIAGIKTFSSFPITPSSAPTTDYQVVNKKYVDDHTHPGAGTVTSVSVVTANGVSGTVANHTTTPAITLELGAITPTTVNDLTLAKKTVGFEISGGTTSKTLTVADNASVSGTNTGDQTIQTLGNVDVSTAQVGQTLVYRGDNLWTNGNNGGSGGSVGPGVNFYPNHTVITASGALNDIPIYTLSKTPAVGTQVINTITTIPGETSFWGIYLYDTALGITTIDAGPWLAYIYAAVSSTETFDVTIRQNVYRVRPGTNLGNTYDYSGNVKLFYTTGNPFDSDSFNFGGSIDEDSYIQTPSGLYRVVNWVTGSSDSCFIEVPAGYVNEEDVPFAVHKRLFQFVTSNITNATVLPPFNFQVELYPVPIIENQFTLNATDKLSIGMFGSTSGTGPTIYFTIEGNSAYSHMSTPLIMTHNDLSGLQGGTTDQYYHLTESQYNNLGGHDAPIIVTTSQSVNTLGMTVNVPKTYLNKGSNIITLTFVGGKTLANWPVLNGSSTTAGFNPGDTFTFTLMSDDTILVQ